MKTKTMMKRQLRCPLVLLPLVLSGLSSSTEAFGIAPPLNNDVTAAWGRSTILSSTFSKASEWSKQEKNDNKDETTTTSFMARQSSAALEALKGTKEGLVQSFKKAFGSRIFRGSSSPQSPTVLKFKTEGPPPQPPTNQKRSGKSQPTPLSKRSPPSTPPPPDSDDDNDKEDEESIVDQVDLKEEEEEEDDGVTLGDIMGTLLVTDPLADINGNKSGDDDDDGPQEHEKQSSATTLAEHYGIHHPLDRMALTANGNLQRLVSSYYDAPVSVTVAESTARPSTPEQQQQQSSSSSSTSNLEVSKTWDRLVHLSVHDQVFCSARSVITVTDPLCVKLIESGQVGIGQLFRYLDLLPEFVLLDAGPMDGQEKAAAAAAMDADTCLTDGGGGFWREYTLQSTSVSCRILEEFCPNLWHLQAPPSSSK